MSTASESWCWHERLFLKGLHWHLSVPSMYIGTCIRTWTQLNFYHVWQLLFLLQPNHFDCVIVKGVALKIAVWTIHVPTINLCLAQKGIVCIHVLTVQANHVWVCMGVSYFQWEPVYQEGFCLFSFLCEGDAVTMGHSPPHSLHEWQLTLTVSGIPPSATHANKTNWPWLPITRIFIGPWHCLLFRAFSHC